MSEKEIIEELKDIKKLLVLQLLNSGVKKGEIEEILHLGDRHFAKYFDATKIALRMKEKEDEPKRENKKDGKSGKKDH